MRAARLNEARGFDIVEVADPTPGPSELVLRVESCGICGSDLKAVRNMPVGLVMGHEFCGEVVAVGTDGAPWRVGQRVAALPLIGCGRCAPCIAGDVAHCDVGPDMIGVGGSSGGYAEYVRVGARESFLLPDAIDHRLGALVEPLAVGLHTVDRARLRPNDDVLVLGGGPVGQATALWARHLGARRVVVSDPVAARRDACSTLAATDTLDPSVCDVPVAFRDLAGRGPAVVFECVGVPGMVQAAVNAASVHGQVIIAGVCTKPDPFVPVTALMKELTMSFVSYYRTHDYAYTIAMLQAGRIDASTMITDDVDLDGFPAAFEALHTPTTQSKVLVHP